MPDEQQQKQKLDQDRAQNQPSEQSLADSNAGQSTSSSPQKVGLPWGILAVAIMFDLVGLIPILNIFTEVLATLIFGLWQKSYNPKLDPLLNILANKIIDFFSLGIYPSNIGMVLMAYIKKKIDSMGSAPIVKKAAMRLAK